MRSFALLLCAGAVQAAERPPENVDEVADLLRGRWYEAEIILFERLDVLDTNSAETLALTRPRTWPAELTMLPERLVAQPEPMDVEAEIAVLTEEIVAARLREALTTSTPQCAGFLDAFALDSLLLGGRGEDASDELHPDLLAALLPRERDAPSDEEEAAMPAEGVETQPLDDQAQSAEPGEVAVTPLLELLAQVAAFENELEQTSLVWLAPESLTMIDAVKAINRQRNLRPIFHGRWRQAVPPREQPLPIHFAADIDAAAPATHDGFAKVEGYFSLTVARYLHFAPRLWYHADTLGLEPVALPLPSGLALAHGRGTPYMELVESRRMRSGDLHYIDHPKIGLIVRVDPVAIPESLTAAWEALTDPGSEHDEGHQQTFD